MKTTFNLLIFFLVLPALANPGNGYKGKYTKEKKISKAYIVNDNAGLDVSNMFGSIYVTTWNESKTQIEVVIKVSGNKEDKVNKRLETIDVDFEATKSLVRARTRIGNMNGNNISMEINYTIRIPKQGSIDLKNQYGSIITGKIYGRAKLDCQYGDVNIDELHSNDNSIVLQYSGTAKGNFIKGVDVDAQYSQFNLGKGDMLRFKGQYTGMFINDINDVNFKSEYGEININNADKVTGTCDYTATKFGRINGLLNLTAEYGDIRIDDVAKTTRNITINSTYTQIKVKFGNDYPFDFEFHTNYSNVNGTSGFKYTEKHEKDFKATYKGYHISSGKNRVYIKSEYGDINLGRN